MAKQRPGRGGKGGGGGGGGGKRGAKGGGGGGGGGGGKGWSDRAASDARVKKMERYEDTLEDGGVDDFMFKRDQIMFNPQDESDDALSDDGEEVLSLNKPLSRRKSAAAAAEKDLEEDYSDEDDDEGEYDQVVSRKMRKEKLKPDLSTRGRFGKAADSDEEDLDLDLSDEDIQGEDEDEEDEEEGWGRQYYSRPSTRREKEVEGEYDEKREEERELEEKEVRRLQKKAAEGMTADDWGVDGDTATTAVEVSGIDKTLGGKGGADEDEDEVFSSTKTAAVPTPQTTDPAVLIRHMESNEPVKLALAREWPHVVKKLEKTARGIRKLEAEKEGQLHKGLGWLHYQTLLTYASTLAFYIHLASLPPSSASGSGSGPGSDSTRPDLSTHPILPRLLQLKEGVSMLEDLDFAAGSVSEKNPLLPRGFGEDEEDELDEDADEELIELMRAKRELMARMQEAGVTPPDEDEDEDEDEEDEDEEWRSLGLEEGELDELMRDAEDEDEDEEDDEDEEEEEEEDDENEEDEEDEKFEIPETFTKAKKGTKGRADAQQKVSKKTKKADKIAASSGTAPSSGFVPLEEPAFYSSGPKKSKSTSSSSSWFANTDDTLGDPTALLDADATDKAQRRRSLQFHTAKIASTANRREKARQARMSGDEDLPRRDRRAARDAALRKNGPAGAEGEDLDGREWTKEDRKRAREVRGEDDDDEAGDAGEGIDRDEAEGYYELIKRRKTDTQSRKEAEHETNQAAHFAQFQDESSAGGPRALTRAIEKNRGLTPRRSKSGRNPRVKKRQAYEKAKQKVGSQRAVFKGGQASLGGNYAGEKTGISTVVKSRKF